MLRKDLKDAYENDNVSISQIADRFNLDWDYVQRARKAHRKRVGLKPLNRARKPGFTD